MRYFANPSTQSVRDAMTAGLIDCIDTPRQGTGVIGSGVTWCADNGCFSDKWDAEAWWAWLVASAGNADTCAFAVAPDVVGDAAATLDRSRPWLQPIRDLGYLVAFVAQDGLGMHYNGSLHVGKLDGPTIEWSEFDVLFIGGSTKWKLGGRARSLALEARRRGKWVHMGRVNSLHRLRYAEAIGCDSVDGTFLVFGPDKNLPRLTAWLTELRDQRPLPLGDFS